ncbi:MAG: RagB/SusD family nutrient uptake outer membrane protein [Bacteroidia bacterium]|nr:RagB/SusD family nutrient uptake outer membrane protein [Bacteroidia bacterium]
MKFFKSILILSLAAFTLAGCTQLEEALRQDLDGDSARTYLNENTDISSLILTVYDNLDLPYQDQSRFWAMQEHTADEVMGPTRGPDWDDNGIWRQLHNHTWDADHLFIRNTFDELLRAVFNATNVLAFNPSAAEAAEARFLRAFVMASVLDAWGQVPFREAGESLLDAPQVKKGTEAAEFIISEIDAIIGDLPTGDARVANQDAAQALKAKVLLNKGVYANRENPSFDPGDMAAVVTACDAIINSGRFSLADNYFDNFAPRNTETSPEMIFVAENLGGERSGNVRSRWYCTLHYNQNPSGWNGFCTIADFYDTFDESDPRTGGSAADRTETAGKTGVGHGFLIGQQVDKDGNNLEDRKGNPLSFTKEVALTENGGNLEVTGVRVVKYIIDLESGDNVDNDYVFFRYADVLLMKAEALLRSNDAAGALALVNEIRAKRGVAELSSIDEQGLLNERGYELYWEGHRRQDLIRFGKFLDPWTEKGQSGSERLLFPIPNTALAVNPNLEQNPGY